jgi:hypothetical protein
MIIVGLQSNHQNFLGIVCSETSIFFVVIFQENVAYFANPQLSFHNEVKIMRK